MTVDQECHCGKKLPTIEPVVENKIVGGNPVPKSAIPWQVGITENCVECEPFCGGTIIGPKTILTAAHCFLETNPSLYKIMVGVTDHSNVQERLQG